MLGLKCTVYLPRGASKDMKLRLEEQGSEIIEFGRNYFEASTEATRVASKDPKAGLQVPIVFYNLSLIGNTQL